jgi:SAM-dependent methyltransferase
MTRARFHYVDDYRRLVQALVARLPLEEAMSRAVGGSFDAVGELEKQLLLQLGLRPDHTVIDVGCGSGRLAKALVPHLAQGHYGGTDVVDELLQFAAQGCPAHWRFERVEELRIPFPDDHADFACFFSVFTHLLPEESFCYLREASRVVKPGGRIVLSFLEYADNWGIFEQTWHAVARGSRTPHINMFLGRDALQAWADHLGLKVLELRGASERSIPLSRPIRYDDGTVFEGLAPMGQSLCVIENSKTPRPRFDGWSGQNPYGLVQWKHSREAP